MLANGNFTKTEITYDQTVVGFKSKINLSGVSTWVSNLEFDGIVDPSAGETFVNEKITFSEGSVIKNIFLMEPTGEFSTCFSGSIHPRPLSSYRLRRRTRFQRCGYGRVKTNQTIIEVFRSEFQNKQKEK